MLPRKSCKIQGLQYALWWHFVTYRSPLLTINLVPADVTVRSPKVIRKQRMTTILPQ